LFPLLAFPKNDLAVVSITIKNLSPKDITNVVLTEALSPVFVSQPEGLFTKVQGVLAKNIDLIRKGNSYSTSYVIKLAEGIEIPEP
jgi:hypothetical protein